MDFLCQSGLDPSEDDKDGCTLVLSKLSRFLDTIKADYPTSATQLKRLVERNGSLRSATISIR